MQNQNTVIAGYDFETQAIEPITLIGRDTDLAIAPHSCFIRGRWVMMGWNLYAIENGFACLVETYDSEAEAQASRGLILQDIEVGAEMVIV